MNLVWDTDLATTDKMVLLALADWSNDQGQCWPSIAQICTKSGLAERSVQGALKRLDAAGHVVREQKPGKGTFYTVNPRSRCTPAAGAPPQEMYQTPAAAAPNTSVTIKSKIATQSHSNAKHAPFVLPDWIPADAWAGWMAMRAGKRATPKGRAIDLAIAKLERLKADGNDPGAVLDQSTERSWTGLFPIKPDGSNYAQSTARRSDPVSPSLAFLRYADTLDDGPQADSEGYKGYRKTWGST